MTGAGPVPLPFIDLEWKGDTIMSHEDWTMPGAMYVWPDLMVAQLWDLETLYFGPVDTEQDEREIVEIARGEREPVSGRGDDERRAAEAWLATREFLDQHRVGGVKTIMRHERAMAGFILNHEQFGHLMLSLGDEKAVARRIKDGLETLVWRGHTYYYQPDRTNAGVVWVDECGPVVV